MRLGVGECKVMHLWKNQPLCENSGKEPKHCPEGGGSVCCCGPRPGCAIGRGRGAEGGTSCPAMSSMPVHSGDLIYKLLVKEGKAQRTAKMIRGEGP